MSGCMACRSRPCIRARYFGSRVVVLHEPTSSLHAGERRTLDDNLRRMAVGAAILYVSHFLEDVLEVCDSVTVLRDGRLALEATPRDSRSAIRRRHDRRSGGRGRRHACADSAMPANGPGLPFGFLAPRRGTAGFTVALGERVGLYGLEGSRSREALEAIFGL